MRLKVGGSIDIVDKDGKDVALSRGFTVAHSILSCFSNSCLWAAYMYTVLSKFFKCWKVYLSFSID